MRGTRFATWLVAWAVVVGSHCAIAAEEPVVLNQAVLYAPAGLSESEEQAVRLLEDEIARRSNLKWPRVAEWPPSNLPVLAIGPVEKFDERVRREFARQLRGRIDQPEGFSVLATVGADGLPKLFVLGNDSRGLLYGVGWLLRKLHTSDGRASLMPPERWPINEHPVLALRGHQLGYRPKTNAYDAWDLPQWERYLRDLILFGANAIELVPPRTDDDPSSPHFPRPPLEMVTGMSVLADRYGLDVWIWYPALESDYQDPAAVARAESEWTTVFSALPRVDAVFVPGGDPGRTQPRLLFDVLARQAEVLHRAHPRAEMWVSPQGFTRAWYDEFIDLLHHQHPTWLAGVVHGPQVRVSLDELLASTPAPYRVRNYPDITHNRQCQFPIEDWDRAWAVTLGREAINPGPRHQQAIFQSTLASERVDSARRERSVGFITYSEGCNDDVNKAVWSALGWNPAADVRAVLGDYCRAYLDADRAADLADGLWALETNWQGPLAVNHGVEVTLAQFRDLEREASPALRANWRFQMALYRAYYDAYTRRRLAYETETEARAYDQLRTAPVRGALAAIEAAEQALAGTAAAPIGADLRARVVELGDALFASIGMQLSVSRHRAIAVERGATLDTLDYPLNDGPWLRSQFAAIRQVPDEPERLAALERLVSWTDPGPGGYYDDLGNASRQPHLVRPTNLGPDPGHYRTPRLGFDFDEEAVLERTPTTLPRRGSWIDHAEALYDSPLELHYPGLDARAAYRLRVVYAGDGPQKPIRLTAVDAIGGNAIEIHAYRPKPSPPEIEELAIPWAATAAGELRLTWRAEPGQGGNGRGCQVAEVWLLKSAAPTGASSATAR